MMISLRRSAPLTAIVAVSCWVIACSKADNPMNRSAYRGTSAMNPSQRKCVDPSVEYSFGPTVAGRFYTDNPTDLRDEVQGYLKRHMTSEKVVPSSERLVGIIAPHAGYQYSGDIAGAAYSVIDKDIRKVVVLSPSHQGFVPYACALDATSYKTPLGKVRIDRQTVSKLVKKSAGKLRFDEEIFRQEHALDVQIPFVQLAIPHAMLVPIIVPMLSKEDFAALGKLLYETIGSDPDALVVVSSDLSHFYSYDQAKVMDENIIKELENKQLNKLIDSHDKRRGPCGIAPISVALNYLANFSTVTQVRVVASKNSGDTVAGDSSRVVGYAALALSVQAETP